MYWLMEICLNYLLKKNILKLSSIEDSFFLYKRLEKKIKLTSEIIALNYIEESPYLENESNITFIVDYQNLYLWFYKEKKRYLPEALFLFRRLKLEYNNSICIFEGSINRVLVIKDGIMIASFIKKNIQEKDITLIKDEFFLQEIIFFSKQEYESYIKNSFKYVRYSDLLSIFNFRIDFKSIVNRFVAWSALPILISVLLLTAIISGYDFYRKNQNEKLLESYRNNTRTTVVLKERMNTNEELNEVFNALNMEFKYIDKAIVISEIIRTTNELNMTLDFIRISDITVDFIIKTKKEEQIPFYTKRLFKSKLFSDIKNISSQRVRNSIIKATMQAKLKER